jgi:glycosyltransferase involved in cell wall biosynthesis
VDFVLAGSVCQALGQSPRPPNVALLGHQENLDALLDSCDLLVSPMDMRTGINVKVLRALARGLRVVTTPSGARGYDGLVGGPIRVAPLPGFAPLVRAAQRLSAAEWSGIAGAYGWPAVIARRLALYERLRAPGGPFPRG